MSKIEETLKKIAAATSKENTPTSSSTEPQPRSLPGDPNCPICGGIGYLRQDVPVGHPDFGKVTICSCRQAAVTQSIQARLFRFSNLEALKHLTFDTFQARGRIGLGEYQVVSLESAYNHARQFSKNLQGWILFLGDYGAGKTHLAAAIANFTVSMGVPTLFITVPDLLDWLRFAYDSTETSFEERFEEIRNIQLLVLDDFGTQNATPWAQEKLFQILNYRYISRLPVVVTSNQALEEIEPRIRSRLQDPELVTTCHILAPDYRNPTDDIGHHELSSLSLHNKQTFSNFSLRRDEDISAEDLQSLEKAFKAAQVFGENPHGWLVLTGKFGCGKTHLAAAVGNFRASLGYPPVFVTAPDLLDHLRATFNPNSNVSYDRRFDEIRTTPLLILDDLGTQSATAWAKEKLYQIFNYRYNAELPTLITTSDTLDDIDERLRSRMLDRRICQVNGITVPFYHGADHPRKSKPGRRTRRQE
ncbi:MAG: ATP-binding protein [Chloroflexi bacterium]|nr:ATP-binding protein [Chloroflexota bacterium]